MLNLKLKTIADLVNINDTVIDIGCDHAYLAIYLKKENLCKEVYASDISENVLKIALKNLKDNKVKIQLFLSNGFQNIPDIGINTAIISGMGTSTIIDIIKYAPESISKFIISSNNNYYELRTSLLKCGYYIQEEIIVFEKNKVYPIMLFTKNKTKENRLSLKYGKSKDKKYFLYLLNKEKEILKNIPKKHFGKRLNCYKNIRELKKILIKRN